MSALELRIGYEFINKALLTLALTHPSLGKKNNNQRLEFLGDAVLGLVVAELLYEQFPNEQEGELARRQAALVRGETLVKLANDLQLGEALIVSASEAQAGGRVTASNLEDAMEALIGAIYLDGGLKGVTQFALPHWSKLSKEITTPPKDAKTALQEWAQARGLAVPTYTLLETAGPSHAPNFTIEVLVTGYPPATAQSGSKRQAEQLAAGKLLEIVGNV